MRNLYLNRDFANAKKDTELRYIGTLEKSNYYYANDDNGVTALFVRENDVDAFIEAGFIREELPKVDKKEWTDNDMMSFLAYSLAKNQKPTTWLTMLNNYKEMKGIQ